MSDFEQFLMEQFSKDYHGLDDEMPDAFEDWLSNLDVDEWIKFAEQYAKKREGK